jgi:hypothetical protein
MLSISNSMKEYQILYLVKGKFSDSFIWITQAIALEYGTLQPKRKA